MTENPLEPTYQELLRLEQLYRAEAASATFSRARLAELEFAIRRLKCGPARHECTEAFGRNT